MTAPPVDGHRASVELLLQEASFALAASWSVDGSPEEIRSSLAVALPDLAATYGSAAATLGADWYDDLRDAADVAGRFRAIVADLPNDDRLDALVGWGSQPLFTPPEGVPLDEFVPDLAAAQSRVEGGFQRLVADMDRDTVIRSLTADPQGKGWSRQTTGKSCPFCVMLAGRGTVYSAKTANFSSHDHCDCIAVPVFGGDPRPVVPYVPSQRRLSDSARAASNARVREFIRANP